MTKKDIGKLIKLIPVLLCCIISVNCHSGEQNCNHVHPKHHEVLHTFLEPAHVVRKRSIDQNLRILMYYDESVFRLNEEKFQLINDTILPQAVHFWETALFVRRTESNILLTRRCLDSQVFVKNGATHCIEACAARTTCGEVEVPAEHLDACRVCNTSGQSCGPAEGPAGKPGPGIPGTDFVFYVSATQTERCNKSLMTVAYAAHCQQETALDRPIAGHANLCPNNISTAPQEMEVLLSTVKHEILHALGFSISLYAFYRDKDGNPLTPRKSETGKPPLNETLQTYQWSENVIAPVTRLWSVRAGTMQRTVNLVVTPNVAREARAHFDCPQLEGAELEDQGGDGTALTHWEKRLLENEAMTGTHTQNPIISRITLALMEDTGWYTANYSMAEEMNWGKGLGCDFAMKSCKEWINTKSAKGFSVHPFCNKVKKDPIETECTTDRTSVALCNLITHEKELPKMYQNFDAIPYVESGMEGYYGGSVSLADYCPYIQEFKWLSNNVVVRGSHCQYAENNPKPDKNYALERYSEKSRCFEHTNQMWEERSCRQMRQWQHWGSGCYGYRCQNGRLHILVGNYSYECFHANQEIYIRIINNGWLHKGGIICPPCREICAEELSARGERCKPGDEAPPATAYPRDELRCSATDRRPAILLLTLLSIFKPTLV